MVSVVRSVADTLKDAQHPEAWIEAITAGLSEKDSELIRKAFSWAQQHYPGHHTVLLKEELFKHVMGAATIVAELDLLPDAIAATLLCVLPIVDPDWQASLSPHFPPSLVNLIAGVNQVDRLTELASVDQLDEPEERQKQAETMRKMLLAMVTDIRVVLIKLALRTQTMHALGHIKDQALVQRIAKETLDLFAPLANRLGVWQIKWELEDLGFRYQSPQEYSRIAKLLDEKRTERLEYIDRVLNTLQSELKKVGIHSEVAGRPKHIYSIYKKMRQKKLDFEHLYDIRAVRILVDTIPDCYTALGIIHGMWQPIPGEFDDYISHPKANDYRSLHTVVIGPENKGVEVQIRTFDMHEFAEFGVAAHWRYKEGGKGDSEYEQKIAWLRQLLDWRESMADSDKDDLADAFKTELFNDTIYVLTPKGRVLSLPHGATPIDFAYALHTDIGNRCRGAKVEGQIVPLSTPLENGQRVEIIAAKEGGPSVSWLYDGWVKSNKAINKIRLSIRQQNGETIRETGKNLLDRELSKLNIKPNLQSLCERLGHHKLDELYQALGHGEVSPRAISKAAGQLKQEAIKSVTEESMVKKSKAQANPNGILVDGVANLMTVLAKCCKPAPPDQIMGFVTKGRGISIHRHNCPAYVNMAQQAPEKIVHASWGCAQQGIFPIDIELSARDRSGLLRDVSDAFSRNKINVTAVQTLSKDHLANMRFTVEVKQVDDLPKVIAALSEVKGVINVYRL